MARAARFKAWQSKARKGRFYYHIIGGNSKTVNPSQSYPSEYEVLRACQQEWISFAKALGVYGAHTQTTFLATHPVPFTKDSLQPKLKMTPRAAKAVKAIKRHAAVEKIVEGARIGAGQAYSAPPSKGRMVLGLTVKAKRGEDLRKLTPRQLIARGKPIAA